MPDITLDFPEFGQIAAQILAEGNQLRFTVNGNSMRPFIRDGDGVELKPLSGGEGQPRQVVLCRLANGRMVVHRALRWTPDSVLVQGDALLHPDGMVPRQDVLGIVTTVFHGSQAYYPDGFLYRWLVRAWLWLTPFRGLIFRAEQIIRPLFRKG